MPDLTELSVLAGRYRIERELGRGATAVVYLARDLRQDREVAVKVLNPELMSGFSSDRFQREIRISSTLLHPHILPLYDSGEEGGRVFFVMAYVNGETLRDRLERERALAIPEALRLTRQIAEALAYAHAQGVVHRDIKPENILIANDQSMVADFGIARAIVGDASERLTQTGLSLGTPHYMSPEQAAGETKLDGRSDIYSLACVTYEMLAGSPPFDGPNVQVIIARHLQQAPSSVRIARPTVPEHVEEALACALAKTPADRFGTAVEFADALERGLTSVAPTIALRRRARTLWRAVEIAAAALIVAGGAREVWSRWIRTPHTDPNLLAIAPFSAEASSLAGFSRDLVDLVSRNLNGAGPLRVVPPSVTSEGWSGRTDEASAVRLGRRTSARASIVGAVFPSGSDSVRLTASIYNAGTGRLVGDVVKVAAVGRVDRAADSLTVGILEVLSRERPLGTVRPPSANTAAMAALKTYLQGEVHYQRNQWDSAQTLFERAVKLDSSYAMALHRLSFVQSMRGSGLDSLVWFHGLRAGRMNRGLPERDSLVVTVDSIQAAMWYVLLSRARASDSTVTALRPHLFSTLEFATRRFPEDPEIWYMLSVNLNNWGEPSADRYKRMFDALTRTISLDSAFFPAYSRAIGLAAVLEGREATRRYIAAYLSRGPTGPQADAARLDDILLDPRRAQTADAEKLLTSASPRVLLTAWGPLLWSYDSTEAAIRLTRRLLAHPDAARLDPRGIEYPRFLLANSLAARGHVKEACALPKWNQRFLFPELALLGCSSPDSTAPVFAKLMTDDRWQPNRISLYLPWWYAIGDTVTLRDMRRRGDSASTAAVDARGRASGKFLSESAQAYLALMRGDSAEARRRFLSAPDSLCQLCQAQRLAKSRLLDAAGMTREALLVVSEDLDGTTYPLAFARRLQRARLAEKLGDRARAIDDYTRVANAWANGDPALRDSAKVARAGLQRLTQSR